MGIRPSLLSLVASAGLAAGGGGALVAAVGAPAALAASAAPSAVGQSAEGLTGDRATLVGTFLPGDEAVVSSFEYGRTSDYGIGTVGVTAPAGTAPVQARAEIAGLGVGETWHYRLVVRSRAGVAYGPDATLTTPVAATAPLVVPLIASPVGVDGATLRAGVDPAGQDTTVVFEYGLTPEDLVRRTAPVIVGGDRSFEVVGAPIGGLIPFTTYVFRALATNATGTTVGPTLPLVTPASVTKIVATAAGRTATWGRSSQIVGRIDGVGIKGVRLALMRQDFPFSKGPSEVATTSTAAGGAYGFTVGPLTATTKFWVQARVASLVSSAPVVVYGKLRVALKATKPARTKVTLTGTVAPHVAGARATLQRRAGSGRWITVSRPTLTRDGQANRSTFTATGRRYRSTMKYRLLVDPRNGGAQYATASNVLGVTRAG